MVLKMALSNSGVGKLKGTDSEPIHAPISIYGGQCSHVVFFLKKTNKYA